MNDPVRGCEVYKNIGCSHVDGYLCDYPDCSIRKNYMNQQERIDALAKQCYSYDHMNFDYNRFAKMIVIECLNKIEDEGFEIWEPVIVNVKNHFGVEE